MINDILAPQSVRLEPEDFQARLIEHITAALKRNPSPPCLLRAPTGAGKTFIISRVLENVCNEYPTIWFWFVPFVTLVQQTEDSIASNCSSLAPTTLTRGRNREPSSGMVLISTAQGVAKASARKSGYKNDTDDEVRSLADLVDRGRAKGLRVGLVVDEAHIGLDTQTEFGQFAKWLTPDLLVMASATPRDQRITDFLASAGFAGFESFTVSRDEVVSARLNKRYIDAIVYDLRKSMQTITDLEQTVLRQAWKRNQRLKRKLQTLEIPVVPLLLVQVANGATSVADAKAFLVKHCKVPLSAIGEHSADEPNPVLMAAIANDTSKEVLIFKQSAGTGFDAPRAFVLASTKPVLDADFALQFVGRVMRVTHGVRNAFPRPSPIDIELDTAYVYLANAMAQQGFEQAVQATSGLKSQLEGQTEKLVARQMSSGAVLYSNRTDSQQPLLYESQLPEPSRAKPKETVLEPSKPDPVVQPDMFGDDHDLDEPVVPIVEKKPAPSKRPTTVNDLQTLLADNQVKLIGRTERGRTAPLGFGRETRPEMSNMSAISRSAAAKLAISPELQANGIKAALDRFKEKEIHTELTEGVRHEVDVAVVTDRVALAREAMTLLRGLPQVEEEDARIIVEVLSMRMLPAVVESFDDLDEDERPTDTTMRKHARDVAYWVIRREADTLSEILFNEIAAQAVTEPAASLPDFMVFPSNVSLESSAKNIFGVLPPSSADIEKLAQVLTIDVRTYVTKDTTLQIDSGPLLLGSYDGSSLLNNEERDFAKALDRADFVKWWHRNPDRKPYSVRIVRAEHKNYFYPDFIVCLEHFPGDEPLPRLIETKENVKDASRKSKHVPARYGRVLFLTKDQKRLRIVESDGSLGETVDLDDLANLQEWMRATRPAVH
jgi:type III restriction enzyme